MSLIFTEGGSNEITREESRTKSLGLGNTAKATFTATLQTPVVAGSVKLTVGGTTITDSNGTFNGSGYTGSVNLTSGALSVVNSGLNPASLPNMTIAYKQNVTAPVDKTADMGVGDGVKTEFTVNLLTPIVSGSVKVTVGSETITESGGTLTGTGWTGTLVGAKLTLTFETAPDATVNPKVAYKQNVTTPTDRTGNGTRTVNEVKYSATLEKPIVVGSLRLTQGSFETTDKASGAIDGNGFKGNINRETGALTLTVTRPPADIKADYKITVTGTEATTDVTIQSGSGINTEVLPNATLDGRDVIFKYDEFDIVNDDPALLLYRLLVERSRFYRKLPPPDVKDRMKFLREQVCYMGISLPDYI